MMQINLRHAEVADGTMPGHSEGDLIISKNYNSAIVSFVTISIRSRVLKFYRV
jgi:hypothetical protein